MKSKKIRGRTLADNTYHAPITKNEVFKLIGRLLEMLLEGNRTDTALIDMYENGTLFLKLDDEEKL